MYKSDADLQAAHAAFPWIVTPDDHDVSNDYANAIDERGTPPETFLLRRAAAKGYAHNSFKIELAKRSIIRALSTVAGMTS